MLISVLLVLFAGCADDNGAGGDITSPEDEKGPSENDTDINEDDIGGEDASEDGDQSAQQDYEPRSYDIRFDDFLSRPSVLEVNKSDTVFWTNFQDDPIRIFTLTSEDGLWEDVPINYRKSFNYTFTEVGTYNYSVRGWNRMNGTVIVK